MKKIVYYLCLALFIHAQQSIEIVSNNKKYHFDLNNIPKKYYISIQKKAPFDTHFHLYTGVTLKTFAHIIASKINSITFIAYDEYKVIFNKNEINNPDFLFVFLEDNKPIPLSKRGPAKIIYTKNCDKKHIFKSIFLIKKAIIEN